MYTSVLIVLEMEIILLIKLFKLIMKILLKDVAVEMEKYMDLMLNAMLIQDIQPK